MPLSKMNEQFVLNQDVVERVIDTVSCGLTAGLGRRKPGFMCVEAAVCYALGEPHGDDPECVDVQVRGDKISLNDLKYCWKNKKDRAGGLLRLSVLQLGTKDLKSIKQYRKMLDKKLENKVINMLLGYCKYSSALFDSDIFKSKFKNPLKRLRAVAIILQNTDSILNNFSYYFLLDTNRRSFSATVMAALMAGDFDSIDKGCNREFALAYIEAMEETLVELGSPGAEYLYLIK